MGSLNIAEWTPDQVADWLSGLGPTVASYAPALRQRGLNGSKLLTLRCDDLEYLGIYTIGHQELILEAVEHLRNFAYEVSRECVQQLALRVSAAATSLARALRHHADARLETPSLAAVAQTVHAVKPLVCWLDRWACGGAALGERKAALLQLALEAATCAQRDRFAEQPARAVAAAAAAAAQLADYIIQDVSDPSILQPASLDSVTLRQGTRALGFEVVPSFCGHRQLANIRFGSPAHASGAVHDGDEIVQVGGQCVVGWGGAAVQRLCAAAAAAAPGGELALRLRRRGGAGPARTPPLLAHARPRRRPPPLADDLRPLRYEINLPRDASSEKSEAEAERRAERRAERKAEAERGAAAEAAAEAAARAAAEAEAEAGASSDDSEPLSPPASPTQLHLEGARLWPGRPRGAARRRHSVSGASPPAARRLLPLDQFWQELQQQRWERGRDPEPDGTLYRRDKAVSYSTGLERSPRGRTGVAQGRGRLDKSHSTPAYDSDSSPPPAPAPAAAPAPVPAPAPSPSPPSPPSESWINALRQAKPRRGASPPPAPPPPPPPRPAPPAPPTDLSLHLLATSAPSSPPESVVVTPSSTMRPSRDSQGSLMRPIAKHEIRLVSCERRALPPINGEAEAPQSPAPAPAPSAPTPSTAPSAARGLFPSAKTRSLKKKNSILAKRREVGARALLGAGGCGGGVWQRVRGAEQARWARRQLVLAHSALYAFRSAEGARAACMILLQGCTVCAAAEVKSRAHAFKVYHTGTAFYFAADSRDAMLAWIQLLHRATMLPDLLRHHMETYKQFSETDYSDSDSDTENSEKRNEPREREKEKEKDKDKDKDKSKFGSLKKLTHRMQRTESQENVSHSSTSLDRKYLRFFSRNKTKEPETKHNKRYVGGAEAPGERAGTKPAKAAKPAKPLDYIHASNPNLLDFDHTDFLAKPAIQLGKRGPTKPDSLVGLVTLEQFMLQRQAEERQQRAGHERARRDRKELQAQLQRIVPDVIYGELRAGADGYEKINLGDGRGDSWRDSLRRNDKVHSGARPAPDSWAASGGGTPVASGGAGDGAAAGAEAGAGAAAGAGGGPGVSRLRLMFGGTRQQENVRGAYPHLVCPPTFQPESYSLAQAARRPRRPAHPQHPHHPQHPTRSQHAQHPQHPQHPPHSPRD